MHDQTFIFIIFIENEKKNVSQNLLSAAFVIIASLSCTYSFRTCCMFLHELPSFIAGLLFAVHPIHTEAVSTFL